MPGMCLSGMGGTESRLADQAGLLDADQKESLCNTLVEISEREQVDVICYHQ